MTFTSRIINRTAVLAALVATVALLALSAMAGVGPVGDGVSKPSASDLGLSIGGKVSGSPSRRK